MNTRVVEATPESFAEFGKVFKVPVGVPTAKTTGFSYWSDIVSYHIKGETEIGWCTVYRQEPNGVSVIERHVRTPEILIPIDAPVMIPVMNDKDTRNRLEVFRVKPGEAVIIADGVWHGACLPVGKSESSYFVIFRKGTPAEDVEKREVPFTLVQD